MAETNILFSGDDDSEMFQASLAAQNTFKYYWRELSWENRRIIPALDLNATKVAFETDPDEEPSYEHMWVNDLSFDGFTLSGTLMNDPNWVSRLSAGDSVSFKLGEISDWMYAIRGRVYGAYTVNLMRSRMSKSDCQAHDNAWGFDFGDPAVIEVVARSPIKKKMFSMFRKETEPTEEELMSREHPMCVNMVESLKEQLAKSDEFLVFRDERGNSMLHSDALAGNALVVEILIAAGADPNLENLNGQKPVDLAKVLEWENVLNVLPG
ncbi:MAG: DUF2314 domain-containing protein [Verrucomicrobiota bacterium]